jgi:hypothetical protein
MLLSSNRRIGPLLGQVLLDITSAQIADSRCPALGVVLGHGIGAEVDQPSQPLGFRAGARGFPILGAADSLATLAAVKAIVQDEAAPAAGIDLNTKAAYLLIIKNTASRFFARTRFRAGQLPYSSISEL